MDNLDWTSKCFIVLIPLITCFSSFVMGYFISYLSMLQLYFRLYHSFTSSEHELYFTISISAIPVGGLIGALLYKRFLSTYYENKLLIIVNFMAILAISIQMFTFYWPFLVVSRLIMGFYCGIISGLVPSYIMSISPSFTNGIIGTFHQTLIVLGMAFAYYMGTFKNQSQYSQLSTIRIIIGFPLVPIIANLVCLCIFPYNNIERYIKKNQNNKIKLYLKMIYGRRWKRFQKEIQSFKTTPVDISFSIKTNIDQQKEVMENKLGCCERLNCQECKNKSALIFGIVLAATSQLSGSDTILEYVEQLFLIFESGDKAQADKRIIILGLFQFIVTFASGFFINRLGKRPMMLFGMVIILVALLLGFLITFFIDEHESYTVWVIFLHTFGFSVSIGPLCFTYAVQVLQNIRIVLITYWGLSIITSFTFDFLIQSEEGVPLMFCIYFIASFLCFLFLYKKMVETKNVPRKQIYEMIQSKSDNSTIFVQTKYQSRFTIERPNTDTNGGLINQGLQKMKDSPVANQSSSKANIFNSAATITTSKDINNNYTAKETNQNMNKDFI